jgi:hypothetical protein
MHYSVKKFLLSGFVALINLLFIIDSVNRRIIDIIITYLSYSVFET